MPAVLEVTSPISDDEIVDRVRAGETGLYEILIRRYNQRLFRIARSILHNGEEAEDVMQDAYVRAYEHLSEFLGRAKFSTWLTKIAVYEALRRARRQSKFDGLETIIGTAIAGSGDPETLAYRDEMRVALERAIYTLPDGYRTVLVLRLVEGLDVADTAEALEIGQEAVKTRLHRARGMLRKELHRFVGEALTDAFPFHLVRCDRVVAGVFARIRASLSPVA